MRGAARKGGPYRKRSSSAPGVLGKQWLSITVVSGKCQLAERKSEGVVVAVDGQDNTTWPERRTPTSSVRERKEGLW